MKFSTASKLSIIFVSLLLIDQISKIWIKTNMSIGESIPVFGQWFQIYFIENKGMAFGMQFGGDIGKLLLTFVRIILSAGLIYYIAGLIKKSAPTGVLIGLTLILSGAVGNLIDSLFYGIIFGESSFTEVATLFPEGGGYSSFAMGKVVDMLYFPIIDTVLPDWLPIKGGERFIFFSPIFNFADSCVSVGAIYMGLFHWKYFSKEA